LIASSVISWNTIGGQDLRLQDFAQVPADRLAFAVRVGGEQQFDACFTALQRATCFFLVGRTSSTGEVPSVSTAIRPRF